MGYTHIHAYSYIDRSIYLYIQNTYPCLVPSSLYVQGDRIWWKWCTYKTELWKTSAPPISSLGSLAQGGIQPVSHENTHTALWRVLCGKIWGLLLTASRTLPATSVNHLRSRHPQHERTPDRIIQQNTFS